MRITEKQLRRVIRETLLLELENPGDTLAAASQKALSTRRSKIEEEMNYTADWLQGPVAQAVENSDWPVRTDRDLLFDPDDNTFLNPESADMPENFSRAGFYIPAGTSFGSLTDKQNVRDHNNETDMRSLREIYDRLSYAVNNYDLRVSLQSSAF